VNMMQKFSWILELKWKCYEFCKLKNEFGISKQNKHGLDKSTVDQWHGGKYHTH
jgi:hypothetical protein